MELVLIFSGGISRPVLVPKVGYGRVPSTLAFWWSRSVSPDKCRFVGLFTGGRLGGKGGKFEGLVTVLLRLLEFVPPLMMILRISTKMAAEGLKSGVKYKLFRVPCFPCKAFSDYWLFWYSGRVVFRYLQIFHLYLST